MKIVGISVEKAERERFGIMKYQPPEDYSIESCWECGHPVYIGPRQREYMVQRITPIICQTCAKAEAGANPMIAHLGGEGGNYD